VNAVSEQDLDLLEEYLDEALAPDEVDALRARLGEDVNLAAALQELRREREIRAVVFAANEPSDERARQFAARVSTNARRNELRSRVLRTTRFAAAAAACLMLGVFVGWLGREGGNPQIVNAPMQPFGGGSTVATSVTTVPDVVATPGVSITEIRYKTARGPLPMLLVSRVTPGPQGAGTGLREGDLLLTIDGQAVRDVRSLSSALASRPGLRVIRIVRDNQVHDLSIQIQSR
jgi:hypothetical protein